MTPEVRASLERIEGRPLEPWEVDHYDEHGLLPRQPGDEPEDWSYTPADEQPDLAEVFDVSRNGQSHERQYRDDSQECQIAERPPIPEPVTVGALAETHKAMRRLLIEGVLRFGETACINAKAKLRKSWTAYSIAVCVATGRH